ncbi:EcsC family protein [Paenibacillus flagellatus]|uniref:ABC transporter-associated protein EcsC n=1 Tax=Paenibacillus flagellatus TaxID=2211139 RepID=A0A2V5K112_9BACL|nr:EcsC family protein [Paenibacillus flagellatus]PYI52875.1 ABC transporter-associated protein EcsC [Paenibacillus flagellatus]
MNTPTYEETVRVRLTEWERRLLKPPGLLERTSKTISTKINEKIPAKVHAAMTTAVKGIFRTVLFTLDFVPNSLPQIGLSLEETDEKALALVNTYKKIAAAEGAGTGAGGFALGLVDFPALIAIKMKCLFELAHLYGYSTRDYRERLFLLYVFQLAFSGREHKYGVYRVVREWDDIAARYPPGEKALESLDWEKLQQEYRDAIDFRKMLQLVPGIGAIVGAWANYGLLEELGDTAIHAFRLRRLNGRL